MADALDLLFGSIRAGECVVVVGAGLGETCGGPSWPALSARLAGQLAAGEGAGVRHDLAGEVKKLVEGGRALLALSSLERHLGRERCEQVLRAELEPLDQAAPSEAMRALAVLPFRAAVTTGRAGPLGRAISEAIGRPLREASHETAAEIDPTKRFLLWACGRSGDSGSLILTGRDLRRALAQERGFRALLETVYRERTLLFVGFRPGDPDLELLLTRLLPSLPPTDREHFLAIGGQTLVEAEELLDEHRIRTIEIGADEEGAAHAGLARLLGELRARCEREGVPLAAQAAARPAKDDVEGWVTELVADPKDEEARRAVDRLERELREERDWERLIEVLLGRVEATAEPARRIETLREVARLFELELGDLPKAFASVAAALHDDPLAADISAEAERLADAAGLWSALVAQYAELAPTIAKESQGIYFSRLGRWYAEKLHHAEYAIASFEQARKADPARPEALEGLAALYRKQQRWGDVADVLDAYARSAGDVPGEKKVELLLALGDVAEANLKDLSRASAAYREALKLSPANLDALTALETLLRRQERWSELIETLQARAERETDVAAQAALRREIGKLLDDAGDLAGAAEAYEAAAAPPGGDAVALRALEHLYDRLGRTEDYLRTLERLSDCVPDDKAKTALYRRMAAEWEERPGGGARAVEWWERILEVEPRSEEAYRALGRLHRSEQRWEALCECLFRHAAIAEGTARQELLAQAARVLETEASDPHRAIDAWTQVLSADAGSREAREALARLSERVESYERAIDLHVELGERLASEDRPAAVEHTFQAGGIARDRLDDDAAAEGHFVKALALDPAHLPSMMALVDLYTKRGELLRATKLRVEAEAATQNRQEKARLLFEAATAYQDRLELADRAAELYERVLALDPEHVEAGERLVDLRLRAERWADAEPMLDMLVRRCDSADRSRLARLARDLGRAAEASGNLDKAVRAYKQAMDSAPDEVAPVAALAALAYRREDGAEAEALCRRLVTEFRSALAEHAVVEAFHRLGALARKRGDLPAAEQAFVQARAVDPGHRPTLLALADLAGERGDHRVVIEARRALLETSTPDERAQLLEEIGDAYWRELGDKTAAVNAYLEALAARPDSRTLLHSLLELYSEEKQWRRAVEMVRRLVEMTREPAHRAKYYYAAAAICRDEIGPAAYEEAIELLSKALDEEPGNVKAFDAMEKLLEARGDHRGLARAYRKMIKRLPPKGEDELLARLWQSLADVCLGKLGEQDAGIAALEVVAALNPDGARQDQLTRLYIEAGATYAEKAIAGQQALLRREPDRLSGYRTLRRLYVESGQREKAWCLAGALRFLGAADASEIAEWEAGKPNGFAAAKRRLTEELWQKHIIHPAENRSLSTLFGLLMPVVAPLTAQPLAAFGLKKSAAVDPSKGDQMVVKLFRYATHTLGVTPPDLFLRPESKEPLQVANVVEKGSLGPALLVGAPHLDKHSEKDLLFELTKRLAFLRSDRYLRYALPQPAALAGALAAAMAGAGVSWQNGVPVDKGDVDKLAAHLRRALPPAALEQLGSLTRKLAQAEKKGATDVAQWIDAIDLTASRAAFILANDFEAAARLVTTESASGSSMSPKERLRELLLYSVSEDYFAVRKHLGFELGTSN